MKTINSFMKNQLPNIRDAFVKIVDVIDSCTTPDHIMASWRMIIHFHRVYKHDEAVRWRRDILEYVLQEKQATLNETLWNLKT